MDTTDLKEKNFESDIEQYLLSHGGYTKGTQATYDRERAIDMPLLIQFIEKTQGKIWKRYQIKYGAKAESQLYRMFQNDVHRYGLIYVLRKGIDDHGMRIRFCYFEPASQLNSELVEKYNDNILTVTRQFAYSKQNKNTIDMVLSLNGIPIIAIELKNQFTGQNIEHSKMQWRENRDPKEPLFHFNNRILAYFGADLYEVAMTTELKREKTFFIPFNQGSNGAGNVGGAGNPANTDNDYVTAYLWKEVLHRKMILAILQRYISKQEEEKLSIFIDKHGREKEKTESSVKIIFPRYHQLDVVEKLVADTYSQQSLNYFAQAQDYFYEEGIAAEASPQATGQNYLIQHSAGSGKSNSIAWLTYRLASLHNTKQNNVFNTIFVVTDRRVLNKQLQNTILSFDHIDGQIETITDTDPSTKLRDVINNDNTRIVITTLHRFPIIYKELTSRSGKRYAIIVDEAHSSQSGKSAEKLKAALADTDEALRELASLEEREAEQIESEMDALMEDLLAQGQHSNLSFYAFTATPKPKTLQTFGLLSERGETEEENKYVAYHNYSMLQAIEEGFIKDVLQYYTTYQTSYEIAKQIEDNPEYEESPATRAIKAYHDNHQHVIEQKSAIIVEKFKEVTLNQMSGKAKAMLVCSSRAHAVRYFMQIKRYCQENNITNINPMVAFSGKVSFNEVEYTESQLNSTEARNISEAKLPLYFASDLYNMLIVADKYQTGFDEPMLHTMFVDKKLKNVKAVQTLSRLNRWQKEKKDTYVLDFVNQPDEIKMAFEPFYKGTELINPVDVNFVYTFRKDIELYMLWTEADEARFYELWLNIKKEKDRLGALSNVFKPTVDRYQELPEEKRFEARSKIKNFVRFYSYMAQIARTYDKELYKAYIYADYLYRLLPKTAQEKVDLSKKILLINSKITEGETVSIKLDGGVVIKGENPKAAKKLEVPTDLLSKIIDKVNLMYQGQFSESDRVIVESIYDKMVTVAQKRLTKQANNTDEKQFGESIFPEIFDEIARDCYTDQMDSFVKLFENRDFYQNVMTQMAGAMYENFKKKEVDLPFTPEVFTQKLLKDIEVEFDELRQFMRPTTEAAEYLIKVITAQTTSKMDGVNDLLIDSFNRLYCQPNMKLVDKRRHFNTIVTKFEPFLKKLYYLINSEELKSNREDSMATFRDCIFGFQCLKGLKHNSDSRYQKFFSYLELVKQWRNDESHIAPSASAKELKSSIHIVATMYLFVVAHCITELEMQEL
ncbi:MAG: type I restriction endonuclease subunit R [Bacteroidales bacterium]